MPGPIGAPGMPEWGMLPIPKKLLEAGRARHGAHLRRAHERHELRHLRPPRLPGEPRRRTARPGSRRRPDLVSTPRRGALDLLVDEAETGRAAQRLDVRRRRTTSAATARCFSTHVLQADEGCDLDFLARPGVNPEPEIH